jgi:hypothetical protein
MSVHRLNGKIDNTEGAPRKSGSFEKQYQVQIVENTMGLSLAA